MDLEDNGLIILELVEDKITTTDDDDILQGVTSLSEQQNKETSRQTANQVSFFINLTCHVNMQL